MHLLHEWWWQSGEQWHRLTRSEGKCSVEPKENGRGIIVDGCCGFSLGFFLLYNFLLNKILGQALGLFQHRFKIVNVSNSVS